MNYTWEPPNRRSERPGHAGTWTCQQLGRGQKQIAAAMGVSVAGLCQIEHGEITSVEVTARYVEALGGRLDLVADFGDRTVRLPVSDTATARITTALPSHSRPASQPTSPAAP